MKRSFAIFLTVLFLLSSCQADTAEPEETTVQTVPESLTDVPESSVPEYVWSTVAPTDTEEESIGEYAFTGSFYHISPIMQEQLADEGKKDYMNLLTTIMMGKEAVRIHTAYADLCVQAMMESFPLVALVESLTFVPDIPEPDKESDDTDHDAAEETEEIHDAEYGTMQIVLKNPENWEELIDRFAGKTAEILSKSGASQAKTKDEAVIRLYRYISQTVADWSGESLSVYDVLMGNAPDENAPNIYPAGGTQAYLMHYLLLQCGVQSTVVTGELSGIQRAWCAFALDGNWYYCDPNCEMTDNGGTGLFYFGMREEYRKSEGYKNIATGVLLPDAFAYQRMNQEGNPQEIELFHGTVKADHDRFDMFRESFFAEVSDAGVSVYYFGVDEAKIYRYH